MYNRRAAEPKHPMGPRPSRPHRQPCAVGRKGERRFLQREGGGRENRSPGRRERHRGKRRPAPRLSRERGYTNNKERARAKEGKGKGERNRGPYAVASKDRPGPPGEGATPPFSEVSVPRAWVELRDAAEGKDDEVEDEARDILSGMGPSFPV